MSTHRLLNEVREVVEPIQYEKLLETSVDISNEFKLDNDTGDDMYRKNSNITNGIPYFSSTKETYYLNELVLVEGELYLIVDVKDEKYYIMSVAKNEYVERILQYLSRKFNVFSAEEDLPTIQSDGEVNV